MNEIDLNNAVAHVTYLRSQGKPASEAVAHAVQRFGVSRSDLLKRVNGYVADPAATQAALASVRERLLSSDSDAFAELALLRALYNAITGENL